MRKQLIIVLALALVAGLTIAAYAEVQNVKVSGDITVQGVARNNLTLSQRRTPADEVEFGRKIRAGLIQTRVKVEADLTDNVMATVRLLSERVLQTSESSTSTDIDIDLAYVTLKEFLYSPLSLTIGRQELRYGNGFIIGDPDTNAICAGHSTTAATAGTILPKSMDDLSLRKSIDAIKAVLNYDPLVIDLVWSKISEGSVDAFDDSTLYGINAGYTVNKDLNAEAYTWARKRDPGLTGVVSMKSENLFTSGAKATFTGIKNLSLGLEGAFQYGEHLVNTTLYPNENTTSNVVKKVNAYALQAIGNYAMSDKKFKPLIGGSYTYLSGEKYKSSNGTWHGWDSMSEDQASGTLFNKILGYSNAQLFNVNGSIAPIQDVRVGLSYYYLMLNKVFPSDGMISLAAVNLSGVNGDPTYAMKGGTKSLGQEIDLGVTYDYTSDVQFGLNAGAFIPGAAFNKDQNKDTAKQVIGSMKVTF
ncbi:MAG: alginate export family protein [Candidatus Omnitrophica bacterium]|nr:alginate export family protein [Candidatus Omnitrophota bacterium]